VIIIFKKSRYLFNIKDIIYNIQNTLLFLMLLAVAVLQFGEVILRYILHTSLMGIEEILIFPTIWLFFLGSANASLEHTQINAKVIELFLKPPKMIKIYKIIVAVLCFIIDCWMTYWAYKYFQYSIRIHRLSGFFYIPLVYAEVAVFIGLLLMGIYTFLEIIYYFKGFMHEFNLAGTPHL